MFAGAGSDDGTVKLWDERVKGAQQTFGSKYQITSVCLSDDSQQVLNARSI